MKREWKPGDVALVDGQVAFVWSDDGNPASTFVYTNEDGESCSVWAASQSDARPLVVIDAENREQVHQLIAALIDHARDPGSAHYLGEYSYSNAQAALRSLIAPPKPPEPQGLGAVVEDESGLTWVRRHPAGTAWVNGYQRWAAWHDIDAVRVLSEGVEVDR